MGSAEAPFFDEGALEVTLSRRVPPQKLLGTRGRLVPFRLDVPIHRLIAGHRVRVLLHRLTEDSLPGVPTGWSYITLPKGATSGPGPRGIAVAAVAGTTDVAQNGANYPCN